MPNLLGLTKTTGPTAWGPSAAGFTGAYTNIANGVVVTQSVQAWSCLAKTTPITVTNAETP